MAYVEWALGLASRKFDAASVALDASRGYETPAHRAFMRATVLVLDAAVCVSALAALAARLETTPRRRAAAMVMALSSPALILVDHGHFQYNCLPLGLTLWCAYAAERIYSADGSRRRRGRDADSPWRLVAAAATTRIVLGDGSRPRPRRE